MNLEYIEYTLPCSNFHEPGLQLSSWILNDKCCGHKSTCRGAQTVVDDKPLWFTRLAWHVLALPLEAAVDVVLPGGQAPDVIHAEEPTSGK